MVSGVGSSGVRLTRSLGRRRQVGSGAGLVQRCDEVRLAEAVSCRRVLAGGPTCPNYGVLT